MKPNPEGPLYCSHLIGTLFGLVKDFWERSASFYTRLKLIRAYMKLRDSRNCMSKRMALMLKLF